MANLQNLTTDEAKAHRFGGAKGNPRNPGGWKKEDTARYKLERMMELTTAELKQIIDNPDEPLFSKKMANAIAAGDWKVIESMINQVYGQPKQQIDTSVALPAPLVDLTKRRKNGADNSAE